MLFFYDPQVYALIPEAPVTNLIYLLPYFHSDRKINFYSTLLPIFRNYYSKQDLMLPYLLNAAQ